MVSRNKPLNEREDSDVKCIKDGCNNFAKVGSVYCSRLCASRVYNKNRRMGITKSAELVEEHIAPDSEPFDVRWKKIYLRYGTDPRIKERFKIELQS